MPTRFAFLLAAVWVAAFAAQPGFTQNQTTVARQVASNPNIAAKGTIDPRDFLGEIEGKKALAWVKAHNEATFAALSKDPRFATYQAEALKILQASDRIATPSFARDGMIRNLWQDADHVQGIWRQTTWASYTTQTPQWETLLDIDALSKAEGRNWVWQTVDCLPPEQNLCLIWLSDGGTDAGVIREFDVSAKAFVKGGFDLPAGKQRAYWRDRDTLYVTREWTPGDVTTSGYGYISKRLRRGQTLDQADEIFRGTPDDVYARRNVLRDERGNYVMDIAYSDPTFFERHLYFYSGETKIELPLPLQSWLETYIDGQAIYSLKADWTSARGTVFRSGAILAFDLKAALADPAHIEPVVIFQPDPHQSVESVTTTRDRLVLSVLSDVTGQVLSFAHIGGAWSVKKLDLPANATLWVEAADPQSNRLLVTATSFLIAPTLIAADAAAGQITPVTTTPARFNSAALQVQQLWATSNDGTSVPYFLVDRKGVILDGTTPTIILAYGGFEASSLPFYSGEMGKLWLEKGGAFVLANIRGGGEFGPQWHEAGLKTKRQVIYDDFQAVALDLIARKITSPRRLGIMGASNGGLLMGVELTQRPDLWNAVDIQVPLLDMINYTHMGAGASWQGEYGNPDDPVEGAFLRSISPYHNVKAGVAYPEPLFETSTKDDRVGPVHARKMAALFEDMGLPFYYYEATEGGHEGDINLLEDARRTAIEYTYFSEKLKDR